MFIQLTKVALKHEKEKINITYVTEILGKLFGRRLFFFFFFPLSKLLANRDRTSESKACFCALPEECSGNQFLIIITFEEDFCVY